MSSVLDQVPSKHEQQHVVRPTNNFRSCFSAGSKLWFWRSSTGCCSLSLTSIKLFSPSCIRLGAFSFYCSHFFLTLCLYRFYPDMFYNTHLTIWMKPQEAAACSGVQPSLSPRLMSLPLSTRNCTISAFSSMQACQTQRTPRKHCLQHKLQSCLSKKQRYFGLNDASKLYEKYLRFAS